MTRPVAVLRPEPGNSATVVRLRAAGLEPIALPLFAVRSLAWEPVDPAEHDGLLITSANTLRHGGRALSAFHGLPVFAVGAATADAAQAAGFGVIVAGDRDAAAILDLARARGFTRLLHLGGRERTTGGSGIERVIAVYASEAISVSNAEVAHLAGSVALLHSARAARQLGALLDRAEIDRGTIGVATISEAVCRAAGPGWQRTAIADCPTDDALIAAARALFD